VGKPDGKRSLGRPRLRWVENIRMNLGVIEWGFYWIGAIVKVVMNFRIS
jgi:hypothetical protein